MGQKIKGRTGWHQATPKTTYSRNHTSTSILDEHFCYCHPDLLCVFCLNWNRMARQPVPFSESWIDARGVL